MSGEILTAAQLTADVDVRCDVAIVGTGAGGAVLAAGLAEAGLRVVLLEAGPYLTRKDFVLHEAHSLPNLYQESGSRSTRNQSFTILQGRGVGGSTAVNWTSCFRTPERILAHWREHHGIELDSAELRPHFEAVERRLNIQEWPAERANHNNKPLFEGCKKLGWETGTMRRNVKGCVNSGYCGMGCPVDGKQSMFVTYLPDAVGQGAMLYADTRVQRLEVDGDRVVALHGEVTNGTRRGRASQGGRALRGGAERTRPAAALWPRSGRAGGTAHLPAPRHRGAGSLRGAHRPLVRRPAVGPQPPVHRPRPRQARLLLRGPARCTRCSSAPPCGTWGQTTWST